MTFDEEELEELAEMAADPTDLLFRAMNALTNVRIEYCSVDTFQEIKLLLAAFQLYKEKD